MTRSGSLFIIIFTCLTVFICLLLPKTLIAESEQDWSNWQYRVPINIPVSESQEENFYTFLFPWEIQIFSDPNLHDLRIINNENQEIPLALISKKNKQIIEHESWHDYQSFHFVPYEYTQLEIDLQKSEMFPGKEWQHYHLNFDLAQENYYFKVLIEGSDNGSDWAILSNEAVLVNYLGPPELKHKYIEYKPSSFRFLKLRIYHPEEEKIDLGNLNIYWQKRIPWDIEDSWQEIALDMEVLKWQEDLPIAVRIDMQSEKWPNLKYQVFLQGENYQRSVKIYASNHKIPASSPDWVFVKEDTLFKIGSQEDINPTLHLNSVPFRYLKLDIEHSDNDPLDIDCLSIYYYPSRIVFQGNPKQKYYLLINNTQAVSANYDLPYILQKGKFPEPQEVSLGKIENNPDYQDKWSDQNRWLINMMLIILTFFLIYIIIQNLRRKNK